MWFLRPVKEFHAVGGAGNRLEFEGLVDSEGHPMGVIALEGDAAIGWCAVGPRARFDRMLRAPTLRGRDADEDESAWLIPCLFVAPDRRGDGIVAELLAGAIGLARERGAVAVEGFPR
ncbi:MAG: GNAT family N-acetyltransferase, partial [Acidimicrobiia bacterium]|nr:GNAT family N-acetyltransferase [Acidimicrobiia bacterium]